MFPLLCTEACRYGDAWFWHVQASAAWILERPHGLPLSQQNDPCSAHVPCINRHAATLLMCRSATTRATLERRLQLRRSQNLNDEQVGVTDRLVCGHLFMNEHSSTPCKSEKTRSFSHIAVRDYAGWVATHM